MNKKNFILIGVLLLLVVSLLISRSCENVEKRFKIFSFNENEIARITMKDQNNQIVIYLNDSVWMIDEPVQAYVKETQINRFIDTFLPLTASTNYQSDSIDRQSFYNVDSTGVLVTILDKNNKQLSKVYIGRSQNNPQISYLRNDKSNKIYQVDNVHSIVNPALNMWREDKIMNITENMISKIMFGKKNESYELFQSDMGWSLNLNEMSAPLGYDNSDLNRLLQSVVNLRTSTFFDDVFEEYSEKLEKIELEILIEPYMGEKIHLKIAKNDENSYVLQKNEEYTTLFRLTNSQFNQLNVDAEKLVPAGDNLNYDDLI